MDESLNGWTYHRGNKALLENKELSRLTKLFRNESFDFAIKDLERGGILWVILKRKGHYWNAGKKRPTVDYALFREVKVT